METVTLTEDELLGIICKAVNMALDSRKKKEKLIPRKRAAKLLNKDVSTLYRWEQNGLLIPVRQGRSVMYSTLDLERLGVSF